MQGGAVPKEARRRLRHADAGYAAPPQKRQQDLKQSPRAKTKRPTQSDRFQEAARASADHPASGGRESERARESGGDTSGRTPG